MKNDHLKNYRRAVLDVFSVTAFCVYTWYIVNALLVRSGLLLHFTTWDVVGYVAYQLTFALVESIIVTIVVIVFSFLLPFKFIRMNLSTSGSLLVFSGAIIAISYKALPKTFNWISNAFPQMENNMLLIQQIIFGLWLFFCLILLFYVIFIPPNERRIHIVTNLTARLSLLVELYIIISIFSLLIVIGRNIF